MTTAPFTFYLGAHHPNWLASAGVPLFVSYQRLRGRRSFPRAATPWALDSGGFTELSLRGAWTIPAKEYVAAVKRLVSEVGNLDWAAPQDWMCEPVILAKTGLSVEQHQEKTIDNFLELKSLAPELPFVPVVQGWSLASYWVHVDRYAARGIDLGSLPRVGVGSVCRRQSAIGASNIFATLRLNYGLKLHGFGLKTEGLRASRENLISSDSLAWSFSARKKKQSGEDPTADPNSLEYALAWRDQLLTSLGLSSDSAVVAQGSGAGREQEVVTSVSPFDSGPRLSGLVAQTEEQESAALCYPPSAPSVFAEAVPSSARAGSIPAQSPDPRQLNLWRSL